MNAKRTRLDQYLVNKKLAPSRSQAENYINLGHVQVNGQVVTKPGYNVKYADKIKLTSDEQYVSRAGLKLASVAIDLDFNFRDKVVLDVGSSTGGFTDYALQHGAKKIIAVDVGTSQLHPSLAGHPKIELHEQTDIRAFRGQTQGIDITLIDVSFISIKEVLLYLPKLITKKTVIVAMVKPQFEVGGLAKHKGVIKNSSMRRLVLKKFEKWVGDKYKIISKADSKIPGVKGNLERFYLLRII